MSPLVPARCRSLIRTWRMLAMLRSGSGVSLERLARELGASDRTIRRDLEALQEAGIAIYDEKPDEIRFWRLVKASPCPICGRAPMKGAELRRELAQITTENI